MDDANRTTIEAACRQLMMRYAAAMDLQDWDLFLSVFAEDVEWTRPGMAPMRDHAQIRAFFEHLWTTRRQDNPHYLDVHLMTTCSIEVEACDRARGSTWCMMYSAPDRPGPGPAVMPAAPELIVLYRDRFERRPTGWRIVRHDAEHLFRSPVYAPPRIPPALRTEA